VKKIRDADGNWDYRRTCVEGPVFDAADVEFCDGRGDKPILT
jgi:dihydroorotate dehydrogenase electron transfer subunit